MHQSEWHFGSLPWSVRLKPVLLMQMIQHILHKYRYIETFLESSANKQQSVPDIFYYAVKSVVHPAEPLVEFDSGQLKPLCVKALKRIFLICDMDMVSLNLRPCL